MFEISKICNIIKYIIILGDIMADYSKELQNKLKQAIKDERYEDAAKIRDEIKSLNNEG